MGKYFVVKGLPLALLVEQNFITNKVKIKYDGAYLSEDIKRQFNLLYPDGSRKILTYKKSLLGFDYPKIFLEDVEINYLLPLNLFPRILTMLPGVIILTNGLIGIPFAIIVSALSTKIFKQVNALPLAIIYYGTMFLFFWIIALMTSYTFS